MAPKVQFSKKQILDAAFELATEQGLQNITVRKLAARLGCSVAPIYVNFENTEALNAAVMSRIQEVLWTYMTKSYSGLGFFNMGIGEVYFARDYPQLFVELAVSDEASSGLFNCIPDDVIELMRRDTLLKDINTPVLHKTFTKMSLITFAIAFSIAKGHIKSEEEIQRYLDIMEETGYQLINAAKQNITHDHSFIHPK